jgi:hypothetical protein
LTRISSFLKNQAPKALFYGFTPFFQGLNKRDLCSISLFSRPDGGLVTTRFKLAAFA